MNKPFAYVANLRLPSEYAIGLYVVKVCEAATKLGYQTHLLHPIKVQPKHFPFRDIWEYYGLKANCFKCCAFQVWESVYKQPKLQFLFGHLRYFLVTWSFVIQALFYLIKNRIEIVQTIDREMIFLLRLTFWYKPKVIYDVHIGPKTRYEKFFDWLMRPRVDLFMSNCRFFKNYYLGKGVDPKKIIVLANGYSPDDYSSLPSKIKLRKRLKLPLKKFIIGYTGRFETFDVEKGVGEILKAAAALKDKLPIAVVAVGGPDHLAVKYRKLAKRLGLASAIIRSHMEPHKIPQYIKSFDIACMLYPKSEHYYQKMSPVKAIEYMAAAKPIIASNLPSITQILSAGRSFLVKPGDQKGLKKTIVSLWERPQLARKKAREGYNYVQQFTWVRRQKRLLAKLASRECF